MTGFTKEFYIKKNVKDSFRELVNWCNVVNFVVIENRADDQQLKILAKKRYPSDIKFSWAISFFLMILGSLLAASDAAATGHPLTRQIAMFLPLSIYLLVYHNKNRGTEVMIKIVGRVGTENETNVSIQLDTDYDLAISEISHLMARYI